MMRSADNPVLVEFREDWIWRQNAPRLIAEYMRNAEDERWTPFGNGPATPEQAAHARAVLGHLLGIVRLPIRSEVSE